LVPLLSSVGIANSITSQKPFFCLCVCVLIMVAQIIATTIRELYSRMRRPTDECKCKCKCKCKCRCIERDYVTPVMRYRLECPANRYVFKSRLNCSENRQLDPSDNQTMNS